MPPYRETRASASVMRCGGDDGGADKKPLSPKVLSQKRENSFSCFARERCFPGSSRNFNE